MPIIVVKIDGAQSGQVREHNKSQQELCWFLQKAGCHVGGYDKGPPSHGGWALVVVRLLSRSEVELVLS